MIPGPGHGATANFLHLLLKVDAAQTGYVALSDQDGIWLPEKLNSAVAKIAPHDNHPVLLGTRSWEWHANSKRQKISRQVPAPGAFRTP